MSTHTQLGILLQKDDFFSRIETEPPLLLLSIQKPAGFEKYEVLSYFPGTAVKKRPEQTLRPGSLGTAGS